MVEFTERPYSGGEQVKMAEGLLGSLASVVFLFLKKECYYFMCMGLARMNVCAPCACSQRPDDGTGSSETEDCEQPCGCRASQWSPLEEHPGILTTEPLKLRPRTHLFGLPALTRALLLARVGPQSSSLPHHDPSNKIFS